MVCLVTGINCNKMNSNEETSRSRRKNSENFEKNENIRIDDIENEIRTIYDSDSNDGDLEDDDDLKLTTLVGGSLINYPPIFSPDGEWLFLINKKNVHVFSTTTGEWIRNMEEGPAANLIYLKFNGKQLMGCSKKAEIIEWKWKSGSIEKKTQLKLPFENFSLKSFNLLNLSSNHSSALITFNTTELKSLQWAIINLENGHTLNCPLNIELTNSEAHVLVENKSFHYFVIAQDDVLHVVNYQKWYYKKWRNAHQIPITCLVNHPSQLLLATGDETGKIFLWRELWNQQNNRVKSTLYHWHHTPVCSIAFTESGTGFYSAGREAVLVKWNIDRPELKDFLPRLAAPIAHVKVGPKNNSVAVSTIDNGIFILGPQSTKKCVIQNFTYVPKQRNNLNKFPAALNVNPKNNCIVLNGQVGSLQFYSTYTKSLLYNIDIVGQNRLSEEVNKILYDARVTNVALNINWMATCEVWDDQEHDSELRLKFWEYKESNQTFNLNTSIEHPHENGIKLVEFSNKFQLDNLVCATVGFDNKIKLWSLQKSDSIYKKDGQVWTCVAEKTYKNQICNSISFSEDGSLLAAGFGNNLLLIESDSMKTKLILTAPVPYDGNLHKVCLNLKTGKKQLNNVDKKSNNNKKVLDHFKKYCESEDKSLLKIVTISKKERKYDSLDDKQKKNAFEKLQLQNDVNFSQKLIILKKLKICCKISNSDKVTNYLEKNNYFKDKLEKELMRKIFQLNKRSRFKAKYYLKRYMNNKFNLNLINILNIIHKDDSTMKKEIAVPLTNGFCEKSENKIEQNTKQITSKPIELLSNINSIHFANGECSHLVVVGMKHRVLIWNLLTLRIESILKISAKQIILDPLTNLCAAFTDLEELYVFLPSSPLPLCHKTHIPEIYGACWVPRKYPKSHTINVDWQSISTLYFLTKKQEIVYLSNKYESSQMWSSPGFVHELKENPQLSIFGTNIKNRVDNRMSHKNEMRNTIRKGGISSAKVVIDMSTHAMAPMSLLSNSFIKSLVITEDGTKPIENNENNEAVKVEDSDMEMEEDTNEEFKLKVKLRKLIENQSKEINRNRLDEFNLKAISKKHAKERIKIEF